MAFVAVEENAIGPARKQNDDRQFRGSIMPDLETLVEGGAGGDGVCG